jgi:hypothetical protein
MSDGEIDPISDLRRRLHDSPTPNTHVRIYKEFYAERTRAGDKKGAEYASLMLEVELERQTQQLQQENTQLRQEQRQSPKWLIPVGVGFGALAVVFLMAMVFLSMAGHDPSRNGKFAVVGVMAFCAAFSAAAWIGNAVMSGDIKSIEGYNPVTVSATGGFAVFILVFLIGYWFYIS